MNEALQKPDRTNLSVFLCHGSEDKPRVRALRETLLSHGFETWFDEVDLLPGQDWDGEIRRAVRRASTVLVCLSSTSVNKSGYLQKEIRFALDVAEEKPDGTIFLIPARLEPCVVPDRLQQWQWVDLYSEQGIKRLLAALRARTPHRDHIVMQPERPASQNPDLLALRAEAATSQKPSQRRAAIRRIATRFGAAELPWLQDFAYSAKHWASRREAIDQVVRLHPPGLVEWLTEMAEAHPVGENRRYAIGPRRGAEGCKELLLATLPRAARFQLLDPIPSIRTSSRLVPIGGAGGSSCAAPRD